MQEAVDDLRKSRRKAKNLEAEVKALVDKNNELSFELNDLKANSDGQPTGDLQHKGNKNKALLQVLLGTWKVTSCHR